MAKKKGSQKASSAAPCPFPSAPTYIDRLAPELKIQILETCNELGGKPLLLPLASTCTEFRRLSESARFGDLKFLYDHTKPIPRSDDFTPADVDHKAFPVFQRLSAKHGHLVKSIFLQLANSGYTGEPMLMTAMIRWNLFAASLRNLPSLERLDVECFTSLICPEDLGADDRLLQATPMLGKSLTSLRLCAPRYHYPMSPQGAAAILDFLPLLTSLHLDHIGGPETGLPEGPELQQAIVGLQHLKQLRLTKAAGNVLLGAQFTAPLELLECEGLSPSALLDVLRPVASTLHTLIFRLDEQDVQPLPSRQAAVDLPRLRHLSLHLSINLSFLDYFSSSPLQTIRCLQVQSVNPRTYTMCVDPDLEEANLAAVHQAIVTHKGRLQRLQVQLIGPNHNYLFEPTEDGVPLDHLDWTKLVTPWEGLRELCKAEGIEAELGRAW